MAIRHTAAHMRFQKNMGPVSMSPSGSHWHVIVHLVGGVMFNNVTGNIILPVPESMC